MKLAVWLSLAVPLSAGAAAAGERAPDEARPVALRPLVLDALEHNLSLRSARQSTLGIETGVRAAQSAFDPLLSATPAYGRGERTLLAQPGTALSGTETDRSAVGSLGGRLPSSTEYSFLVQTDWRRQDNTDLTSGQLQPSANTTLSLNLTQPLLRGFGPTIAQAPVRLADLSAQAARERLERLVEQVVGDVEAGYWSLGLAEAIERLSRDSYERARELMGRNEKLLELKLITEVDAITSRRGVQSRLTALIDAERRRKDAAERLLFLVYGDAAGPHLGPEPLLRTEVPAGDVPALGAIDDVEARSLAGRSDVQAARFGVEQSQLSTRVAKNALLPDARVSAGYTSQTFGTDSFRLFNTSRPGDIEFGGWKLQVTVSYPLRNRAARAEHARAQYEERAQELTLALVETGVRSEVRAAVRGVRANAERFKQAQLESQYAKEQYEAGQKQLQLGLIDSFRFLQMEEDVTAAELTLEQARYDLAVAVSSYELATGEIAGKYLASGGAAQP